MPELPEVEALSRFLDTALRDRVVDAVTVRSVAVLKTHIPRPSDLRGCAVAGCSRHGKPVSSACISPSS